MKRAYINALEMGNQKLILPWHINRSKLILIILYAKLCKGYNW